MLIPPRITTEPFSAFIGRTKCVLNDEYKEKVYFNSFLPHIFIIS